MDPIRRAGLELLLGDPVNFSDFAASTRLRAYQTQAARAVIDSVLSGRGFSLVVMFPRQSGKNELQAHLEAYLLMLLMRSEAEIVKVSPTWKPQSLNAMRRLERVLSRTSVLDGLWQKESGYIYRVGKARIFFLSGAPESNIVGATASTLLEVDEAQDVSVEKFDKEIAPMAASTNATQVFWGTAWTSQTLLARELRTAEAAQQQDGIRRVFRIAAETVAAEVPAYGRYVANQVARLGRSHPLVRTQYFSEEIDGDGGMFPPERRERMRGAHPASDVPLPGRSYALLLDVAGADEAASEGGEAELRNPGRDATALTVVEVDASTCADPVLQAPTYRCVHRRVWVGLSHARLYAEIRALAETWRARSLVVDATGIGAGLASFLERALPGKVTAFQFNAASKSRLGWDFLALVDSGRWREPDTALTCPPADRALAVEFQRQLGFCQYQIQPGPEKRMRWGVPDGTRDPANAERVHDDLLLSAALCTQLDRQPWAESGPALLVPAPDPLADLDRGF